MSDPGRGSRSGARHQARGPVAANVWDHAGGQGPLSVYWRAARDLDPDVRESRVWPGPARGTWWSVRGRRAARRASFPLTVSAGYPDFAPWWTTFTLGVGPAGEYVKRLDDARREALRDRCAELLDADGPFEITAVAWTAVGTVLSRRRRGLSRRGSGRPKRRRRTDGLHEGGTARVAGNEPDFAILLLDLGDPGDRCEGSSIATRSSDSRGSSLTNSIAATETCHGHSSSSSIRSAQTSRRCSVPRIQLSRDSSSTLR